MTYSSPVTDISGVGSELAKKFAVLGVQTVGELLHYYPRRYDDYSSVISIADIMPGTVTIKAVISQVSGRYIRRGMHITEAVATDASGSVKLVWFNQPYRAAALKNSVEYFISGDFALRSQRLSIANPSVELVSNFQVNTARIVPVYRETKGLKSTQIRKAVFSALQTMDITETLPAWTIDAAQAISLRAALVGIHFPEDPESLATARKRLGFEEVFGLTLAALLNKYELLQDDAIQIPFDEALAKEFVSHLPFKLTDAQRKVVWQVYQDIALSRPMNRLVEGDVGSGKTVVAAMAAVMAIKQGYQVALMAPTELLARQHAQSLATMLTPLRLDTSVGLLVGGLSAKDKKHMHAKIADGTVQFVIGTHALIQDAVDMKQLGLIIIDEQHRFGVEQRRYLQGIAGHAVHVLNMTATPIPRSLALTLYGEMDISIIDTKPVGRKPIETKIVSPNSRKQLYESILGELQNGRQMFVVCPLVSESDALAVSSAEQTYLDMQHSVFKEYRIGLLHGKMKPDEKDRVMQQFANHELDILVATTVIEVGVDVPNATVMLIENAERFGLAQIHQLRGRVGRSSHQGYCYLMMSDSSAPSRRLRALETTTDGFALAELDLEIRGPGAIYGTSQHGQLDLRIAKLTDTKLISVARATAQEFIDRAEDLSAFNELHARVQRLRAVTNLN